MEGADDGGALDDGVLGEVIERQERAAFVEFFDKLVGHFAVIEVVRIGCDASKGAGQLRLAEGFAFLIQMAVALEDSF